MKKTRVGEKKKRSQVSVLITLLFIFSTVALALTIVYFSPNIFKQVNASYTIFESSESPASYSVAVTSLYRIPKLTDGSVKILESGYSQGNAVESEYYTNQYIAANLKETVTDGNMYPIKLKPINNAYDGYVYKITSENSSAEWIVAVSLDGNAGSRYVLLKGGEQ